MNLLDFEGSEFFSSVWVFFNFDGSKFFTSERSGNSSGCSSCFTATRYKIIIIIVQPKMCMIQANKNLARYKFNTADKLHHWRTKQVLSDRTQLYDFLELRRTHSLQIRPHFSHLRLLALKFSFEINNTAQILAQSHLFLLKGSQPNSSVVQKY